MSISKTSRILVSKQKSIVSMGGVIVVIFLIVVTSAILVLIDNISILGSNIVGSVKEDGVTIGTLKQNGSTAKFWLSDSEDIISQGNVIFKIKNESTFDRLCRTLLCGFIAYEEAIKEPLNILIDNKTLLTLEFKSIKGIRNVSFRLSKNESGFNDSKTSVYVSRHYDLGQITELLGLSRNI